MCELRINYLRNPRIEKRQRLAYFLYIGKGGALIVICDGVEFC